MHSCIALVSSNCNLPGTLEAQSLTEARQPNFDATIFDPSHSGNSCVHMDTAMPSMTGKKGRRHVVTVYPTPDALAANPKSYFGFVVCPRR